MSGIGNLRRDASDLGSSGILQGTLGGVRVRAARFQIAATLGDAMVWENPGTTAANQWDLIQPITANFSLFAGVAWATYAAGAWGWVVEEGFYATSVDGNASAIAAFELLGPTNAQSLLVDTATTDGNGAIPTVPSTAVEVIMCYVKGVFRNMDSLSPGT